MSNEAATFTDRELAYFASQRLGRLATISPQGAPQNNPVGFRVNAERGTIDIFGFNMGRTKKFHNVKANPLISFVVDDLASLDPWVVRGVEVRGVAEALEEAVPAHGHMSGQVIRIHPRRVITWGVDSAHPEMSGRDIPSGTGQTA
jgi:pyridoxamine 5'-phosphate oxidase family protein